MSGLSVVIPTFDRPGLLNETLRRLAGQSVAPDEVIVVDNGTVPASIAEDAARPFALRYFRIAPRAGVAAARNFGVAQAQGDYVAFLDDDDFWNADYVERLRNVIRAGTPGAAAMIVGSVEHLDERSPGAPDRHFYRFAGRDPGLEPCFYFNPGYLGSCMTVERSAFMALGGFDSAFRTGEDKELAMRYMAAGHPIAYDAGLVAVNRVHGPTLSAQIDHVHTARLLLRKYRAQAGFRIRVKTLREAYKKTRRKRYLLHLAVMKIVLAFTRRTAA
jgi:GT2 family glycosyltransferase